MSSGAEAAGAPETSAKRREEGFVLKVGEKTPDVSGASYDGSTYSFGAPGKRTVLWFYPKANTGG